MMCDCEEDNRPIIRNQKAPGDLVIGDYVFASRWGDCDPGDPWHVGHVTEIGEDFVVVGDVSQRCWANAMKITPDQGKSIVERFSDMEKNWVRNNYKEIADVFGYIREKQ